MRLADLLAKESIVLNGAPSDKKAAIYCMADLMEKSGKITDKDEYVRGLLDREEQSSTAFGGRIAVPHCKGDAATGAALAAMVVPNGVDFDALDGEPVNLIFAIAAPNTKENIHLDVLSKLSVLLVNEDVKESLINAKTPDEFLQIIDKFQK